MYTDRPLHRGWLFCAATACVSAVASTYIACATWHDLIASAHGLLIINDVAAAWLFVASASSLCLNSILGLYATTRV